MHRPLSRNRVTCGLLLLLVAQPVWGASWDLAFEDDFERAEPGENYSKPRGESISIQDGQLRIVGAGGTAMIERGFATDVRLEFDAMVPEGYEPCDLSVKLNSVYLLGFGARHNRANHLIGPGTGQVDEYPPFPIEQGKRYRMVAQREGRRMFYEVNGTTILDVTSDDLLGGPSFDRLGFITWSGMLVDNVRVYERSEPHPDTPVYLTSLPGLPFEREGAAVKAVGSLDDEARKALAALNAGDHEKAKELFAGLADPTLQLAGLAHLYGDPNYYERPVYGEAGGDEDYGEFGAFYEQWQAAAAAHPDNETLRAYLPAVKHFKHLVLQRGGGYSAKLLVDLGAEHNPFYHKAKLFSARYTFWNGKEGGNAVVIGEALAAMRELLATWPDNRVLNEYAGTPVPWGEELNADPETHPAWAAYLREAYAREIAIMERFCDLRQYPKGQFCGGWGDDVEMMRKWVPIAAISTCSTKVLDGIGKLTEGIWAYCTVNGYDGGPADVEHSAEPTADTFPTMLLLHYGDPRYYEFNLASARTIRDVMMGIDDNGYPRFRSTVIGANGVVESLMGGGDTGYHARAMKHFQWLAWYGNAEAEDWYVRWCDGWRNTIMIDEPHKPAGVTPGTIWYPSGSYYPPNGVPWYSDKAYNYYGTMGMAGMIHTSLLNAYLFTGDRKFLRPIQRMMDHATWGPYREDGAEPPSLEWVRTKLAHQADAGLTSVYQLLTGERVYDEYTLRFGTAPQAYNVDKNIERYLAQFEQAAKSLRNNLWYYTTEVMSTDRLHLPAVAEIWGAYSGAVTTTVDAETPTFGVTYETPDADFAALVTENSPTRLRVWLYGFWDESREIALRFWRLAPGEYVVNQGNLEGGERPFQHRYRWGEPERATILRKGDRLSLALPPKTVWVVDLRLDAELEVPEQACDLAIHERDVQVFPDGVVATVHNIGNAAARSFAVALQQRAKEGAWETRHTKLVRRLSESVDFVPFAVDVRFEESSGNLRGDWRVVLDPEEKEFELCETNNIAALPAGE